MTEISLAWLLTKVTSPVVGATKKAHVDGAVNAVNLQLSPEEIQFLEETYQPHVLTGVMAQNTPQTKDVSRSGCDSPYSLFLLSSLRAPVAVGYVLTSTS
ncbi:putative Aryl-alcohol dehydrogenase (NADP(+)) [Escherichia coli]|uniref:Putative Aryl-alcohol dehydrogenase (NADP(+)) n=1 Tax=Escherichia coli TaxID=562 RepID=A0A376S6M6_ECOLX|nr:putative Aryl-alcohol dehydrogenase (NADP(+)) [Escherichia coli]